MAYKRTEGKYNCPICGKKAIKFKKIGYDYIWRCTDSFCHILFRVKPIKEETKISSNSESFSITGRGVVYNSPYCPICKTQVKVETVHEQKDVWVCKNSSCNIIFRIDGKIKSDGSFELPKNNTDTDVNSVIWAPKADALFKNIDLKSITSMGNDNLSLDMDLGLDFDKLF